MKDNASQSSTIERFLAVLEGVKPTITGWIALCPAHDDRKPSLSVAQGDDGRVLLNCFAGCPSEDIVEALGLQLRDLFVPQSTQSSARQEPAEEPLGEVIARYGYTDGRGKLLYEILRYTPKNFRPRRPSKNGWSYGMDGVRRVLYHLPDIVTATHVIVVEGEGVADRLRSELPSFEAWNSGRWAVTTSCGGANSWSAQYGYGPYFTGKSVYVLPDNDEPGRKFAETAAADIAQYARRVKIVQLSDLPDAGDAVEYLQSNDAAEMQEEFRKAPLYIVPAPSTPYDGSTFNAQPLRSYLDEPDEQQSWVAEGLLPAAGMSILAAKPKVGKTTLSRQLALCAATGKDFLDRSTAQGEVIILSLEEKRQEVKEHFRDLGATGDEPIRIHCAPAPVQAVEKARRLLEQHPATRLLIIDPLFKFARVKDSSDYAEVTAALEPLLALARTTGTHVMLVHHCRKGQLEDAADGILGSTAIFANVDTALLLRRYEDQTRTLLSRQRYGNDLEESVLEFDPVRRLTTLGSTRDRAEQDKLAAEMYAFLSANPSSLEADILESITGRRQKKIVTLRQMIGKGVERTGRGGKSDPYRYSCSPEPVAELGTTMLINGKTLENAVEVVVTNNKRPARNSGNKNDSVSVPPSRISQWSPIEEQLAILEVDGGLTRAEAERAVRASMRKESKN